MGRYQGILSLFGSLGFVIQAHAYTPTLTPSGVPVRWSSGSGGARLDLAGNPVNQSGLSDSEVFLAVSTSLQRWKAASGGSFDFGYWQGTDSSIYTPSSAYDGLSALYFASHAQQNPQLSSSVLGLTQVWYDTQSGRIIETDIVLNDRDFRFTMNPADTSGYGSAMSSYGAYSQGKPNVFIENVVTHELGHALGLSHSGSLQSTMLFMESPEQAHLGCDEQIAIHAIYPSGGPPRGSIGGQVVNEQGAALFGAHVVAISQKRGTVLASALSDKAGRYSLSALEPGSYFLMVEPFYAGASTLPNYYAQARADFCSGRSFARTFLTAADGNTLVPIFAPSGGQIEAPLLTAHCVSSGGADVLANRASIAKSTAPGIFDGGLGNGGFGVVDRVLYGTNYYRLNAVVGHLEVHALSYSLYSPVSPSVTVLDAGGNTVSPKVSGRAYQGDSGYVNYDAVWEAENLPWGDYWVRVAVSSLDSILYPAGQVALDSAPFLMVTGSVNEATPALENTLAVNSRCRMAEGFAAYISPPGNPPRHSDEGGGVGFCGTVEKMGHGPGTGRPGVAAILGWLLPFLSMAGMKRWLRQSSDIA